MSLHFDLMGEDLEDAYIAGLASKGIIALGKKGCG